MDRILILEDDRDIAELERDYLEFNGFQVDIASSGKSGLKKALQENYDLIILDINLPEISGFEICRKIRDEKDITIIFVSAKEENADKIRGLSLGADDYLVKPFDPSELVARVKAHMYRYRALKNNKETLIKNEIKIRGLRIDTSSREVFVDDREVTLTSKEYELLLYLSRHPNQVLTKDQIFECVWGYEKSLDPSTVAVHVSKLRDKIEINNANPQYIETKWGIGYRLKV